MRIGALKQRYDADHALLDTATQRAWAAAGIAALVGLPFVGGEYALYLACLAAIHVVAATGLNILTGYTGLVSLGHAAFMGVGSYAAAVADARLGTPAVVNLFLGGTAAALVGVVVGLPSLRVKGLYLAIATIAASVLLDFVFKNWTAVTGGSRCRPKRKGAGLAARPRGLDRADEDQKSMSPMPPIPPMPPPGGPPAAAFFSGRSATMASVVISSAATEAAPCSAVRTTLAGSTMPAAIRSLYSLLCAS